MKKVLGIIAIVAVLLIVITGAFQMGKYYVIYNSIISDEAQTEGTYNLTIDGQTHEYYFEK